MRIIIASIFFCAVSGDVCHDFCLQQLSAKACAKGSWCKGEYDCHSLFWTSADKKGVCVFDGSPGCRNDRPVLCNEARERMSPGTAGRVRTTQPTIQQTPKPESKDFMDEGISLHINRNSRTESFHVKASFQKSGQNIGFPLMLDTGGWVSSVYFNRSGGSGPLYFTGPGYPTDVAELGDPVSRPAIWAESYIESRAAPRYGPNEILRFGSQLVKGELPTYGRVRERVRIFSGTSRPFEFDAEVHLGSNIGLFGMGLLGASFDSTFAQAAGAFAVHGPGKKLYIGDASVSRMASSCRSPMNFNPVLSHQYWTVAGTVNGKPERFMLDTGADRISAPQYVIESIKSKFIQLGAEFIEELGSAKLMRFYNCRLFWESLPDINYNIGGTEFLVSPAEYVSLEDIDNECVVQVVGEYSGDGSLIVGAPLLSKIFTVFDKDRSRVGTCNV